MASAGGQGDENLGAGGGGGVGGGGGGAAAVGAPVGNVVASTGDSGDGGSTAQRSAPGRHRTNRGGLARNRNRKWRVTLLKLPTWSALFLCFFTYSLLSLWCPFSFLLLSDYFSPIVGLLCCLCNFIILSGYDSGIYSQCVPFLWKRRYSFFLGKPAFASCSS